MKFRKRHTGGKKSELPPDKELEVREYKRILQWKKRHPGREDVPPNRRAYKRQREALAALNIKERCSHCGIINPDSYHNCLSSPVIYQGLLQHD